MVFSTGNHGTIRITVYNMELNKVSTCEYLANRLDEKLKWKNRIDIVFGKLIIFVGVFYKLQNKLSSANLQTIYYAIFHPHKLYDLELNTNTHFTYSEKLVMLNSKILRIFQCKSFSAYC